ncbi:MAG: hypothetical protein H6580_13960 [Flammeovirgaceae bacterium]|nr:hypothetical protein [Flammeovirgaceae bacterium]
MDLHKILFVIQSVSDESLISSIKKEIVVQAGNDFRKDSSLTLRMAQVRDAGVQLNRHCEGVPVAISIGSTVAIPNSEQGMGDRHTRLSVGFAMTALIIE